MSWVCILIACSVSPPSLFSLVLGPKSHCLSRPSREALLASPSCYLPFSAARTNPQREAQQKLPRTPVTEHCCTGSQLGELQGQRSRLFTHSQSHPAGRLAFRAIYLPLEDPEAREQTSGFCRISLIFLLTSPGPGSGARTHMCSSTHMLIQFHTHQDCNYESGFSGRKCLLSEPQTFCVIQSKFYFAKEIFNSI